MSVQYHSYVGPYIKVNNPEKESTEKYHGCPKRTCGKYRHRISDQFCANCGTKIELVEVPCKSRIKFDVYEEFDENLAEIGSHYCITDTEIFISNKETLGAGRILDCESCTEIPFDESVIGTETRKMENDFSKEITRLKEVFGEQNVSVLWGVVAYAS